MSQSITSQWLTDFSAAYPSAGCAGLLGVTFSNGGRTYNADTLYQLAADVTCNDNGFLFAASGVTLDLNGHVLTYNNAAPLTVPNGGFTADSPGSTTITSWNISGAPDSSFLVAVNDVYLLGSQLVRWTVSNGSTSPQVIKSNTISIPLANRTYTASVDQTLLGLTTKLSLLKIEVYDSVTLALVTNWQRLDGDITHGNSSTFSFVPTTTNPVYIQITMTPASGAGNCILKINNVVLTQSMYYGVWMTTGSASGLGAGGFSAQSGITIGAPVNLSSTVNSARFGVFNPTVTDSVGTGSIRQGLAAGAYSAALTATGLIGAVVISGITTYNNGPDTVPINCNTNIDGTYRSGRTVTVSNCNVTWPSSGLNVTERDTLMPSIDVHGEDSATVTGCTITNNPHVGIWVGNAVSPGVQTATNNTINPNVVVTNGYTIYLGSGTVVVTGNTIDASSGSGRGIILENGGTNTEVAHNTVTIRELPNREYGIGVPARAFRMRGVQTFTNINIHDNTFIATCTAGTVNEAIACRLEMPANRTGVVLQNNVFRGLVTGGTDPGSGYNATAISIDTCEAGSDLVFVGNTFESDQTGFRVEYSDSGPDPIANILCWNNIWLKSSLGVPRTFTSYVIGYHIDNISNVRFYGATYQGGATQSVSWGGTGNKSVVFGWLGTITVEYANLSAAPGATVTVTDGTSTEIFPTLFPTLPATTDGSGVIQVPASISHYSGVSSPTVTSLLPDAIAATSATGGFTGSYTLSSDPGANFAQTIVLNGSPTPTPTPTPFYNLVGVGGGPVGKPASMAG